MFFGFFWGDWTILILIPGMIFAIWAQAKVSTTFAKYSRVPTRSGLTGADAARRLLNANGLSDVMISRIPGKLTDHYDPRNRTLNLSEAVYDSQSAAAIGVACHEAGHALQDADSYVPLKLRMGLIPVCNIGSRLAFPLFFIGLIFAGYADQVSPVGNFFMLAGILCFSTATVFQAVTLPVEFNASRRAMEGMRSSLLLSEDELPGARKVLGAAAMTYVAALATSLLSLLRLILIANNRRR